LIDILVILTTLKFIQASSASVKEGRGELHPGCEEWDNVKALET